MLPLVWRPEARADLLGILNYIGDRNLAAADRLGALIEDAAERIPLHPFMHRSGRVIGTRKAIVHPNYIVVYRVGEIIEILAVLHARQQYP
jgi:toxin ParE1/3/4